MRLAILVLGMMISTTAWSLDLREGELYRGKILIGKHPNEACQLKVVKEIISSTDRYFSIVMFKKNIYDGRGFQARQYDGFLTGIGSIYHVKNSEGKVTRVRNKKESLHINFQKNQSLDSALILNEESLIVNCVGLVRIEP
ncbi:MAG: hypothetical protein AABY64_04280 [Bdellovibrionota bacterium]